MIGKKSHDLRSFRYGELELALAIMLDARPTGLGSLRGRLKRLSTLGVPGGGGGKGSRREYSWEEATLLAVALLLEDAGLDPVVVASALKNTWPHLKSRAMAAVKASAANPVMLIIHLETIAGPWRTGDSLAGLPWISIARRIDERSRNRRITMYGKHFAKLGHNEPAVQDLIKRLATLEADNVVMILNRNDPGWLPVRNLTDRLNVLKAALEQKDASRGRP
jgi:hypothetical protein